MRTIMIVAIIVGASTSSYAHPSHHQVQTSQRPERFLGLHDGQRFVAPFYKDRNSCNGGACSSTGGPSGGPNQS